MGVLFGLMMGSFDNQMSMTDEYLSKNTKGRLRMTLRDMGQRSVSWAKNFAAVGLIYSAAECFIEKVCIRLGWRWRCRWG